MGIFTRNAGLADPVLSDEAAFFIQLILDDIWPPEFVGPDDDPADTLDNPF